MPSTTTAVIILASVARSLAAMMSISHHIIRLFFHCRKDAEKMQLIAAFQGDR
jgi:hypothetical protein